MTPIYPRHRSRHESKQGSAILITLIILVLVTLLVVSLLSMTGLERASTHSSFANLQAREFSNMAVDEVVATLRDNIPKNQMWAVAPGKLDVFTSQSAFASIPLHSGQASGSTSSTGQVDLNAPEMGATASTYPIISTNSYYGTTPMPIGWVEILQDGTQIRSPSASNTVKTNPVVGRYAYWVDTETSKVNINSAGKGQTSYTFDPANIATSDTQDLTGAPSRVDLSKLDGGITSAQSMATYHTTYGGYFLGDQLTNVVISPAVPVVPVSPQGMKRFNSIQEWLQLATTDPITGASVTALTPTQVEQNKFYLTTRSNTPEVTPWGFNRFWLQTVSENVNTGIGDTALLSTYGNKLNGKGLPVFPATTAANAGTNAPGAPNPNRNFVPDSRYYVSPYFAETKTSSDLQFLGQYDGVSGSNNNPVSSFVNNMMVQLNRTDWPGFPGGLSFVSKYGQAECEDLAFNMLCLFDSTIMGNSVSPSFWPAPGSVPDASGMYGRVSQYTIDGNPRLLSGVGQWPYINQVSVSFSQSFAGNSITTGDSNAGALTFPGVATTYYTKSSVNAGFSPSFVSTPLSALNPLPSNVAIVPTVEVMYPPGFKNDFAYSDYGGVTMVDIEVYATGTYNGSPVTYGAQGTGSVSSNATDSPGASSGGNNPYYWGMPDDVNAVGYSYNLGDVVVPHATGTTASYRSISFPPVYIGPFDRNSTVTDVQFRCRFVNHFHNIHTVDCPLEIVPLAKNEAAHNPATAADENTCFQNVLAGANASPSTAAAPTFLFEEKGINLSTPTVPPPCVTYEVADPRVYRYLSDWTSRSDTVGITPSGQSSIYAASTPFLDKLTGITGDASKFAWPNIGAALYEDAWIHYGRANATPDLRWWQNASHIVGFPGIGWLSVLPTNCESSRGTVAAGTGSGAVAGAGPVPWRTLSLEPQPATQSNQLPDWLLLEAFALAYDQTFCSQTQGKINVNAAISPQFPAGTTIPPRLAPLEALISPSSYTVNSDNPTISASAIATDLAAGPSGGNYTKPPAGSLPSDIFVYPGQICQVSTLGGTPAAGTQWQRESVMRNIAGVVTTQCSDFKVHVVGQTVKQVAFSGNPATDLQVTGEQRMSAIVSRVTNLGPDGIPDTADDPVSPTSVTVTGGTSSSVATSLTVTSPSFKYAISDINYANN